MAQASANATFQGGASAAMDTGALAAALWKGQGKGKEKERTFRDGKGAGNQHWNFMKREGNGNGKGTNTSTSTSVCWSCRKTGHCASNCPTYRVSVVEGEEQLYPHDDQGDWTYFGEPDDWREWTERAVNA